VRIVGAIVSAIAGSSRAPKYGALQQRCAGPSPSSLRYCFGRLAQIHPQIIEEAKRLIAATGDAGLSVRLIGGVAIRLHALDGLPSALERPYQDIDLVTTSKGGRRTVKLLEELGYTPNDRFNALNSGRAVVYDVEHQRQVDLFIGEFRMCHTIDLVSRLEVDHPTVPLAELLLTKLQIVSLNRKDLVDIAGILYGHDVGDHDNEAVNADRIAQVLASDWGLWRTSRGTVETSQARLRELGLDAADAQRVEERLDRLWHRVQEQPKTFRWRSRARIGERTRWYEEPEEVDHDRTGQRS
jgi:hypothetical protein